MRRKKGTEKLTAIRQMFKDYGLTGDGFEVRLRYQRKYILGYYILDRIPLAQVRDYLPEGWYAYAVRESDKEWDRPATLENNRVVVNFWGYFITKTKLDFGDKDYIGISDYGYI